MGIKAPPTLWATFQNETIVPLSFRLNQCDNVLPQAGHPMPCNQPFKKFKTTMAVKEAKTQSENPQYNMIKDEPNRPKAKKTFGLLLSDTFPITNLDMP